MQICVHLDPARLFRWHSVLLTALGAAGHEAVVSFVDNPEPLPTSLTAVFDYDRARSHAGDDRLSTHLLAAALASAPRYAGGGYGLMLDLSCASRVATHPGRVLRPLYDGSYKDYALFDALLHQRAPMLTVADSAHRDHVWTIGRPAIEMPWRPARNLDEIASRLVEGLVRAASQVAGGAHPSHEREEQVSFAGRSGIFSAAAGLARHRIRRKVSRLREALTGDTPKWHVAWRRINTGAAIEPATLQLGDFQVLDDGGKGYFADPFVFCREGIVHVFVEEVPNASRRGIISHFTLAACGTPSPVACVLDTGSHLSYPFVFVHEEAVYMLPESSAAGGLDLYRAAQFPSRWEKVARLIEGRVHDATLVRHGGRWWISAGSETLQSSSWDGLSLYSAEELTGPWQPHALNPVLVDASAARPAGAFWLDGQGHLMRPAQDCSKGYGAAITLRRVLALDEATFSEETSGTIAFAPGTGLMGPHTLSRGGGFELIDLYARPSRLRTLFRS